MDPLLPHHGVVLRDPPLLLRPMTERDWPMLFRWNRNPLVLAWAEGEPTAARSLAETQHLYRSVAATPAYCFVIKWNGREVGECWLQRMNEQQLIDRYPGDSVSRIDIAIGEPNHWGLGIGRRAIRLLTDFGLNSAGADAVFGLPLETNERSRRAFIAAGFTPHGALRADGTIELIACNRGFRERHPST